MKKKYVILSLLFMAVTALAFNSSMVVKAPNTQLEDGDYFIVNVATNDALTPVDVGINSNTYLKDFKKSGLQKWTLKKRILKGKNGEQIYFTIQNTASGFYLKPYHIPSNGNAIISEKDGMCSYSIEADGEHYIIKNNKMGGDAMYVKDGGALTDTPWFAADESTDKFRWEFISTTVN